MFTLTCLLCGTGMDGNLPKAQEHLRDAHITHELMGFPDNLIESAWRSDLRSQQLVVTHDKRLVYQIPQGRPWLLAEPLTESARITVDRLPSEAGRSPSQEEA